MNSNIYSIGTILHSTTEPVVAFHVTAVNLSDEVTYAGEFILDGRVRMTTTNMPMPAEDWILASLPE
jgi:hypothetical protein